MYKRLKVGVVVLFIIALGLLSRKIPGIPVFIGDALYAVMMFYMVKFIMIEKENKLLILVSLCICYTIELSQLIQIDWLIALRKTLPGRLILGQGFLWEDMLAYTVGVLTVFLVEGLIQYVSKKWKLIS